MIFEFPAILLLFLETKAPFRMLYLLKQFSFSKKIFHIWFYPVMLFQNYLFVKPFSWNLTFGVTLVTSFSRQNPLKLKNKNHTIISNTKFNHSANFELKRIKTAEVILIVPFQAYC